MSNVEDKSAFLTRVGALLARYEVAMRTPPVVVMLGEVNSGKTTAANALIGYRLLRTNVLANTRCPTLVRYADQARIVAVSPEGERTLLGEDGMVPEQLRVAVVEVGLPHTPLRSMQVLDTPGKMSAIASLSLGLAAQRIPVWCTLATQAWKESERASWTSLAPAMRRHGVLAVVGLDLLDDKDVPHLMARITQEAAPHFRHVAVSPGRPGLEDLNVSDLATLVPKFAADMKARRVAAARKVANRVRKLITKLESDPRD